MKKSNISMFISIILKIILVLGTICLFILPELYDIFSEPNIDLFREHTLIYQIAFYLCYIISLIIVGLLNSMFYSIYKESPFQKKTEEILKINAVLFMILAIIVTIKVIFIPTILSCAVIMITFIASLSFYVLSQVIKVAIEYKDEVDHTI